MSEILNKNILIIDDDPVASKTLSLLLKKLGAENLNVVDDAISAFELIIERVDSNPIDLIISDFIMPEMTGLDLYKKLILSDINIPFAMVTANSDSESIKEMIDLGINMILVKPVTVEMLKSRVIDHL
ncbi:MAG: CheY-like chemotaxis protein [Bacteriovoracaceae bacterium]|jgi:CheY-like chemotaxis protein